MSPTTSSTSPAREWLSARLQATPKSVLYVSHDRELPAETSHKVVTIEAKGAWTHGGSFSTWREAREHRISLINDEQRRWTEERRRLVNHMKEQKRRATMSDANAAGPALRRPGSGTTTRPDRPQRRPENRRSRCASKAAAPAKRS